MATLAIFTRRGRASSYPPALPFGYPHRPLPVGAPALPPGDLSARTTAGSLPAYARYLRGSWARGSARASAVRMFGAVGALPDAVTFDQEVSYPDLAVTVPRKDPYLQGAPDHFGK